MGNPGRWGAGDDGDQDAVVALAAVQFGSLYQRVAITIANEGATFYTDKAVWVVLVFSGDHDRSGYDLRTAVTRFSKLGQVVLPAV